MTINTDLHIRNINDSLRFWNDWSTMTRSLFSTPRSKKWNHKYSLCATTSWRKTRIVVAITDNTSVSSHNARMSEQRETEVLMPPKQRPASLGHCNRMSVDDLFAVFDRDVNLELRSRLASITGLPSITECAISAVQSCESRRKLSATCATQADTLWQMRPKRHALLHTCTLYKRVWRSRTIRTER